MSKESNKSTGRIQDNSITIRKAKPELNEGLVFAQLYDEASEGFFKSMLGVQTYEIIAEAFVKPNNEFSFENVWIIEHEHKFAGIVLAYSYAEKEKFTKNILSQSTNGSKFRIKMFAITGKFLSRFMGPKKTADYYIPAIAVMGLMRGKGFGQKLLNHIAEIAVNKGCKTLSLDVSAKNLNAINSYTKFGMTISSAWPNFLKLKPVFIRMEKEL